MIVVFCLIGMLLAALQLYTQGIWLVWMYVYMLTISGGRANYLPVVVTGLAWDIVSGGRLGVTASVMLGTYTILRQLIYHEERETRVGLVQQALLFGALLMVVELFQGFSLLRLVISCVGMVMLLYVKQGFFGKRGSIHVRREAL